MNDCSSYPTVVSYFTSNWLYPQYADRLRKNCQSLGINFSIDEITNTHDYIANTSFKPEFILAKLMKYKSPILWLDVDNFIHKPLDDLQLPFDYDIGLVPKPPENGRKWLTCVMLFNYTDSSFMVLDEYVGHVQKTQHGYSDDALMERMWLDNGSALRRSNIRSLPSTYGEINSPPHFNVTENCVISSGVSDSKEKRDWLATKKVLVP